MILLANSHLLLPVLYKQVQAIQNLDSRGQNISSQFKPEQGTSDITLQPNPGQPCHGIQTLRHFKHKNVTLFFTDVIFLTSFIHVVQKRVYIRNNITRTKETLCFSGNWYNNSIAFFLRDQQNTPHGHVSVSLYHYAQPKCHSIP